MSGPAGDSGGPAGFADHFSAAADAYAASRPGYPDALFDWVAGLPAQADTAWEAGCGSGQATVGLARRFPTVQATDPAEAQIAQAPGLANVTYRVAPAERSGLPDGSVDLVFAAQAAHWFDADAFYAEARRVARPGAAIALASYGYLSVAPEIDAVIADFRDNVVGPYWPPERRHVDSAYATLPFPFEEVTAPAFAMRAQWPLDRVVAYHASWSALTRYRAATGEDPLPRFESALRAVWGDPARERPIVWPLAVRAGSIDAAGR